MNSIPHLSRIKTKMAQDECLRFLIVTEVSFRHPVKISAQKDI